jgi:hypothetical protein
MSNGCHFISYWNIPSSALSLDLCRTCGMMAITDRSFCSGTVAMSTPSKYTTPFIRGAIRKRATIKELLPAPVRPQIPKYTAYGSGYGYKSKAAMSSSALCESQSVRAEMVVPILIAGRVEKEIPRRTAGLSLYCIQTLSNRTMPCDGQLGGRYMTCPCLGRTAVSPPRLSN